MFSTLLNPLARPPLATLLLLGSLLLASLVTATPATAAEVDVLAFVKSRCVKCHNADKAKGEFRLDDLAHDFGRDLPRWAAIRDQLRDGAMPPAGEPKIASSEMERIVAALEARIARSAPRLPNHGNQIAHELLFKASPELEPSAPARVWRLSPDGYLGFVREVHRGGIDGVVQPFTLIPERGIRDFAALYSIDEPSTEVLLRNAEFVVGLQTAHQIVDGVVRGQNKTVGEFVQLMDPKLEPTREQLSGAVQLQYRLAIGRRADEAEVERLLALYDKCAADGDRPAAVRTMLAAVLLRTDALYRSELGSRGKEAAGDSTGRVLLEPIEVARAVSLAVADRREQEIMKAAEKGELATREEIAAHVERILHDSRFDKPRLMRFFREYFEYQLALDVFKDNPRDKMVHSPHQIVADTDWLIQYIVDQDRDVLHQLLAGDLAYVNYTKKVDKSLPGRPKVGVRSVESNPKDNPGGGVEAVYGFQEWPKEQPAKLPKETRLGILMQPSWLAAFSTNFDNDPVRRGRWIRERLLGGTVPDLPIGVVAQVPDDPHRTFRDRLTVTRQNECWRCHQQMDELGLPFENFDHYGRFRRTEEVLDVEATEMNVDPKGKPLGPVYRQEKLDTTGLIARSGDSKLDGPVSDPRDMVRRLAASDRVRQVFIRHVFRYFLGRNETLSDAATLQAADRAYVESGGSFKALLKSLLTSDSFLYRTPAT